MSQPEGDRLMVATQGGTAVGENEVQKETIAAA